MTEREREELIAAASTAWRPRSPGDDTVRAHPAWFDLDEAGRVAAYEEALAQRQVEAALDPDGLSATARTVLARIRRTR